MTTPRTGLGWTYCPDCGRVVVVVASQAPQFGVHWAEVGRRCPRSSTPVPDDTPIAPSLSTLKHTP